MICVVLEINHTFSTFLTQVDLFIEYASLDRLQGILKCTRGASAILVQQGVVRRQQQKLDFLLQNTF